MDDAILKRLVQIGTVTDVNSAKRKARVKFKNTGITSGWLTVVQHYGVDLLTYWMPKVNDTVLVLYLPVRDGDGYILGGI